MTNEKKEQINQNLQLKTKGIHKILKKKELFLRILFVFISIIVNAFAVSLYVKSSMGVSTISSVPYIITSMFPSVSLGATTILFQLFLVLVLVIVVGFKKSLVVSFLLGCMFGFVVDLWNLVWEFVAIDTLPNILIFVIAFIVLPFGIAMAISSGLTALPFDIFTKEIAIKSGKTIKFVKTIFDVTCVAVTLLLSFVVFGEIRGIGVGTIISMLVTGILVQYFQGPIKKLFT